MMREVIALASLLLAASAADPMARKVSSLVERTTHANSEADAFRELEALGDDAVPYLVAHLGDSRPLPYGRIDLVNHSQDAFEGMRHYAPRVVHDALSAILNQVTGQYFEFVYKGSSPEQRASDKRQWQAWCQRTFPSKAAACVQGVASRPAQAK